MSGFACPACAFLDASVGHTCKPAPPPAADAACTRCGQPLGSRDRVQTVDGERHATCPDVEASEPDPWPKSWCRACRWQPCRCKPAVEASGDDDHGWWNAAAVRNREARAYARGLADAAEAIAAWLESCQDGISSSLTSPRDGAAKVRNGEWRKHLPQPVPHTEPVPDP